MSSQTGKTFEQDLFCECDFYGGLTLVAAHKTKLNFVAWNLIF